MNERDRKIVDYAREAPSSLLMQDLLAIIDRLDKQMAEIRAAGEPFVEFGKHFVQEEDDYEIDCVVYAGSEAKLTLGNYRRLIKALKEE